MNQTFTPQELEAAGKKAFQDENFPEAATTFQAAAEGYRLAGDPLSAAEMDNNRSVCLLQADEAEEALAAVNGTPELFLQAGDLRRQALALGNKAAVLQTLGRLEEAEANYLESADLLEQLGEDQLRATVLKTVSEIQLRSGRPLDAVTSMQSGLAGVKKPRPQQRLIRKLLKMPYRFMN